MDQDGAGVGGTEPREGAALVGVEETDFAGQLGQSDGHNSLTYLGDIFEEDYYAEGRWGVVRGLSWFVQDYPIGVFEAGGVVAESDERGEQVEEDCGFDVVHFLPDPVGDALRSRGR